MTMAYAVVPTSCAYYEPTYDRISIRGCEVKISDLYDTFGSQGLIEKESEGVYILKTNIRIRETGTLNLDSSDVQWLKIAGAHGLISYGKLIINGVKVTSWDPAANDVVQQTSTGSTPRGWIIYRGASASGYISGSEIAHLGYSASQRRGIDLIYGVHDISITNNKIHHLWFALYTHTAYNIVIDNNDVYENLYYALDPHTESYNFTISNNHVHHNKRFGIIFSYKIWNFDVYGNEIHDNGASSAGLMFSRLVRDSKAYDNLIYNERTAISVSASYDNEIYNNTIRDVYRGILIQPTLEGPADGNWVRNNTFERVSYATIMVDSENRFSNNHYTSVTYYAIQMTKGSIARVDNQEFNGDRIRGADSTNNQAIISESGRIKVGNTEYCTESGPVTFTLNSQYIRIYTVTPSASVANII